MLIAARTAGVQTAVMNGDELYDSVLVGTVRHSHM